MFLYALYAQVPKIRTGGIQTFESCREKKERLWSTAKRTQSQGVWSVYKKIRDKNIEALRRARTAYIIRKRSQLEAEVGGSRWWWSVAKDLAGIIKKTST